MVELLDYIFLFFVILFFAIIFFVFLIYPAVSLIGINESHSDRNLITAFAFGILAYYIVYLLFPQNKIFKFVGFLLLFLLFVLILNKSSSTKLGSKCLSMGVILIVIMFFILASGDKNDKPSIEVPTELITLYPDDSKSTEVFEQTIITQV